MLSEMVASLKDFTFTMERVNISSPGPVSSVSVAPCGPAVPVPAPLPVSVPAPVSVSVSAPSPSPAPTPVSVPASASAPSLAFVPQESQYDDRLKSLEVRMTQMQEQQQRHQSLVYAQLSKLLERKND